MVIIYLIFGIILAVVGSLLTHYYGKMCVRYDETEINEPMIIFIGFMYMVAGILICKYMELR